MIVTNALGTVTIQLTLDALRDVTAFVDKLIDRTNHDLRHLITNFVDSPNKMREKMVMGFIGEVAVAEYLDAIHHLAILHKGHGETDVDGVEVRSVNNPTHCLITHKYDKPAPYVLAFVDVDTATVVLRGWLHLRHCNVPGHWRTDVPKPAYFVPATVLQPMDTLRAYYQERKRR